jgi:hypothetical protein
MVNDSPRYEYLIGLAVAGSLEAQRVDQWLAAGESVAASALAWTEFLNGPIQPHEITLVEAVIESRVVAFDKATAALAAELFNKTGRRRGSRFDCLIAQTGRGSSTSSSTCSAHCKGELITAFELVATARVTHHCCNARAPRF